MAETPRIKLRSPAGNLDSLKRAIDAGADAVYIGFRSETNLRNFPGLNFSFEDAREGIDYAHSKGKQIYITINTYPQSSRQIKDCFAAVDAAYSLGADGIIETDLAVLEYSRNKYPDMKLHLSVQAGASNFSAINFYRDNFGIKCAILPRVLNIAEIKELRENTDIELEVFVFGSLCANYEGRCNLSSYITGRSCNSFGACAPAEFVEFNQEEDGRLAFRLNGVFLNRFEKNEFCSYPTPCKARLKNPITDRLYYPFQDPVTLNLISSIPRFIDLGVDALKIEGRQRSASYVESIAKVFRLSIDEFYKGNIKEHNAELLPYIEGISFHENLFRTSPA